ncbi:MAG: hypothetical protein LH654_03260 [Thermoleophilia bacterium]|nr:hypothetical protein [Thermoleophilia bacterium]
MLGFDWGFTIEGGTVELDSPRQLEASAWDDHSTALGEQYPAWRFPPGFTDLT